MKAIIFLAAMGLFVSSALANHGDKYCAKMKDGKLVVMHDGAVITAEASLDDGVKVYTDGTVVKKDGTRVMLKAGECVDKDGKIIDKEKMKEKEKDKPMK